MIDKKAEHSPRERDNAKLQRLLEAHRIFIATGTATVVCDECGHVIEFEKLSDEAEVTRCSCGKFNTTLRGL
jgi:hypothetical protein